MKPLSIHRQASAELDETMRYYERRRQGLALALHAQIQKAFAHIQANPTLGSPYKRTRFRFWVVRRFPYVIYHKDYEDTVWVGAIAHARRRPGYWRRRQRD
jgi:plasmid stabilization system protein ParE